MDAALATSCESNVIGQLPPQHSQQLQNNEEILMVLATKRRASGAEVGVLVLVYLKTIEEGYFVSDH